MILCWAPLIAVLGRMKSAGHGLDSPVLNYSQPVSLLLLLFSITHSKSMKAKYDKFNLSITKVKYTKRDKFFL